MSLKGWDVEPEEDATVDPGVRERLFFMRIIIVGALVFLLARVYWLQQTQGDQLLELASDNQFATLTIDPPRGEIFDRQGLTLAINEPSFDVTITPAFLPSDENERQRVFERLSVLTGVPVTNTVQQRQLAQQADPTLVNTYSRLAQLYGAPVDETLADAGIVPQLPDSIEEIFQTYSFAQYLPATITTSVPITLAYRIEQESVYLPGVRVIPQAIRNYPSGEYTSQIIGFMGPLPDESWLDLGYERDDRVGWAGLEVSMEEELAGSKGERRIEVDWTGRELRQIGQTEEALAGLNLHLTLDLELQQEVYAILEEGMREIRETPRRDFYTGESEYPEIEQASVVVLNVKSGEVLAMVNIPTFDNNRFATEVPVDYYLGLARNDYEPLLNHAIAGQYPPGSVFKLVTAAAALQSGIISPNRELEAPGRIVIPNRFAPNDPGRSQEFVCWVNQTPLGSHGMVNMLFALQWSCDIYFYKISGGFNQDGEVVEGLGIGRLADYSHQFGFGRLQGIELPIEAPGNIPTAQWKALNYGEPWSTGDDYNAAIGQGFVTSTPMQITQMAAIVANGGFLYRPSLIHHMTDENGNLVVRNGDGRLLIVTQDSDGELQFADRQGNPVPPDEVTVTVQFNENGEYVYQPDVLNAVDVDRQWLDIIAEGMRRVNGEDGTGSGYVDWLDDFGITTAGKTGTAEYCDNIAIEREWCRFEDIELRRILPTHSWYVGYAPFEDPEIAVAAFVFNGDEGSRSSAPIVREVMAAYFNVDSYAPQPEEGEEAPAAPPIVPPQDQAGEIENTTTP
ncbi:MAG TPA: penicillin-binding protein 2 [Candidatus Sulfomarinibacteraceae bacterium]|nr:penicillin-binding protein 2 [Candidatus Sulfomarinibacteraceae bacterium]